KLQTTYKPSESGSYYSWGDKLNTPSNYDISDFFINGMNITNSLSLSSGNEKSQTYISIGNVDANGIIHNNNYNRYNFSVRNTTSLIKDKLFLDVGFMMANVKEQNMTAQGLYFNPLVPLYLFPAGDDFNKAQIFER